MNHKSLKIKLRQYLRIFTSNNFLEKIIVICVVLIVLSGCKKQDDLMFEPQQRSISASQADLIEKFSGLTNDDDNACNIIFDIEDIPRVLCSIVEKAKEGSEIVFLIDKTSSMEDDIDEVKKNINEIIDCLPDGVRLGAATYGDYFADGPGWYDRTTLTTDYDEIRTYVNAISVVGGGDLPESVYDAIWYTLEEMPWQDCDAPDKIIVMGDAPPLEGALTNHTLEEVLAKANSICPDTEFYPVIIFDL